MTVNDWLQQTTQQLDQAGIGTARLDALVLLGDLLNKNSAQLLAEPSTQLTPEQLKELAGRVIRRAQHEPLAYIRQKCEFYGREFVISAAVLVPRPESETMIELLLKLPVQHQKAVVDVGTGSGALAITAACELHEIQVIATDIDPNCLKVARQNCQKHQATVDLKQTNLLEGVKLPKEATILANLPYVPADHTINRAALHEPPRAIFGGADGLDLYRELFEQLKGHSGYVLTETLPFQHTDLTEIARQHGYKLQTSNDFIQVFLA